MRSMLVLTIAVLVAACGSKAPTETKTTAGPPALNPAQTAYKAANDRMHQAMGAIPADPDRAFLTGMIPHHEGAIDMARIELEHGKDPRARELAKAIIAAQRAEIDQMQAWLAEMPASGAPATVTTPVDHDAMGHAMPDAK
ncbi:CopM family metallochaperone [Polymorphobacter fuscus]|uniref:DUF305 domain-containing protein n=1 Tax=Sandarakinorhabdus fusca TaxID=1439888 RepID=A0A7C9KNQ9_9SPHN|nr:DUF305 domain-containing protein [Polymorphobacter fuscus]KAB7645492.1 DUF305 domain-containing protein [Polymorphobacter fuscus]MQT17924.1 DUF305 domain-containing protein [Polymorphobacter fuscus]NJC08554.1 uncharacterized protein (DUF305 family) [Polymorphobacter fuscus]